MTSRSYLLDVSRLIWRLWRGRLSTGVDRVCLEYVRQYRHRSLAVVQFNGQISVLSPADSDRLFEILAASEGKNRRRRLLTLGLRAVVKARRVPPQPGMIYLNVGHTGLHEMTLPTWVEQAQARAFYLVHDLIPVTHPHFCRPGEAKKHAARMRHALESATGIIGNSQATLDQLARFASSVGLPMPPTIAAWIGGPPVPLELQPKRLDRPHFVALGTIEGRKNHILLLEVWRKLVRTMGDDAPVLIIIGQRGWEAQAAVAILDDATELAGHVRELGQANDEEVAAWLAGARALLMPSFAEGFGIPVIEALQLGTPVVASELHVYREVVGDIPTYLEPRDTQAWESVITAYLSDGDDRSRQLRAIRRYAPPDWASHFANVEAWIDGLRAWPCNSQSVV